MEEIQEFRQVTLEEWLSWKEDIRQKLGETAGNFVYIGYRLKQIRDSGMLDGVKNIFEFAQREYGLSKSTVSRFIAINEKFSEGGNSLELKQEYRAFGSSKLTEMLSLTDAECQMITEKTTVTEIRELKSFLSQPVPEENNEDGGGADQQIPEEGAEAIGHQMPVEDSGDAGQKVPEEVREAIGQQVPEAENGDRQPPPEGSRKALTPLQKCLEDFFRDKKDMLNMVLAATHEGRYKDAADLMNPSGHCTHKKGICFLAMEDYNTGVKMKLLTEPVPLAMEWRALLTEIYGIYSDIYERGVEDVYSAYYSSGTGMAGDVARSTVPKVEESPKRLNADAPVTTSQQEEKQKPPKAVQSVKNESPAAGMAEPAEESLPGQMEVVDYPEIMPTVRYEEIPAENSGADNSSLATGMEETPEGDSGTDTALQPAEIQDAAAGVDDTGLGDAAPHEDGMDRGQQDNSAPKVQADTADEEETEEDIFMEANKCLYRLDKSFAVWDKDPMPDQFLQEAYHDAISLAAALEKIMDKRGDWGNG